MLTKAWAVRHIILFLESRISIYHNPINISESETMSLKKVYDEHIKMDKGIQEEYNTKMVR